MSSPNPAGHSQNRINILNAVRCASASDCWAVGTATVRGTNFAVRNLMLHWNGALNQALQWNGKKWSDVPIPNPGGSTDGANNILLSIKCTSAKNCWAVGTVELAQEQDNEFLHWNGALWQF